MKVSLKKAFSLIDGRLSTDMSDVYEMLNFIFDQSLMTHQLPAAIRNLEEENPKWFADGVAIINDIKRTNNTNNFQKLMELIDSGFPNYQIELGKIESKINFFAGLI